MARTLQLQALIVIQFGFATGVCIHYILAKVALPDEVLITSDADKLPPDIAALLDPTIPLANDVEYFEKRYDLADMLKTLWITLVIAILAFFGILFGVAELFQRHTQTGASTSLYPLAFGVVCAFAAWAMFASLWTRWKLRGQQRVGQCTRRGIFLTPSALVQAYEFDTTIIPRSAFIDLVGDDVMYRHNDQEKQFRLPKALVGNTPDRLREAIKVWRQAR